MKQFVMYVLMGALLLSCSKGVTDENISGGNIYVAGSELFGSTRCAVYWKNGVQTQLSTIESEAFDICVSGNDVYVVGSEGGYPMLWKNGVKTRIGTGTGSAKSVFVLGADVYVGGNERGGAPQFSGGFTWKNGTMTYLGPDTYINSMFVNGSDVYFAGIFINEVAAYWLNGVKAPSFGASYMSEAKAIYVSGSTYYMVGTDGFNARYPVLWTKTTGGGTNLLTETILGNYGNSQANSICVSGSDVYIAGMQGYACFWKNGLLAQLSKNPSSTADKVVVSGNDVYISGNDTTAVYWKNATKVKVSSSVSSKSNSIFVF